MHLHTNHISAVLFDMDGVLTDTAAAVTGLWRRAGSLVGRSLSDEELRADVLGCTPEHTLARLFADYSPADCQRVLDEIRAGEPELSHQALPGATRLVQALAAAAVPLALVTSASAGRAAAVVESLHIADCFQARVTWGDVEHGKPDPQPYLIAASRLGCDPGACTVFEDSVNGVRAAVAAGATCIGVGSNGAAGFLRAAGAATVVPSLAHVHVGEAIGPSSPGGSGEEECEW
jgi:HAD superfamily hydrolase (TIGR01509 family)